MVFRTLRRSGHAETIRILGSVGVLIASLLSSTTGPQARQRPAPTVQRWLIAPVNQNAEIDAHSSVTDLQRRFGPANVTQAKVYLGEGESVDGTVVYADDPTLRVEIVWKDASRHAPATARVRGKDSKWGMAPGITLGTSLKEIERLNGGPFTLTGFAYDYSGTIIGWNGGRLASLRSGLPHAFIRLEPDDAASPSTKADYNDVLGDRDFSSSREAMQRLDPRVYEFIVSFEPRRLNGLANQVEPARR
jgi:hypothetical protein